MQFFLFNLYGSETASGRRQGYLSLVVLIIFLSLCHGLQTGMGVRLFYAEAPVWTKAVGALYALINVAVILTQLHLGYRATRFFFKGPYSRRAREYTPYSSAEVGWMLLFTIVGQMVFLAIFERAI